MEHIATELSLLKKCFPFIKFEFYQINNGIKILINNQNRYNHTFSYIFSFKEWSLKYNAYTWKMYKRFNTILNKFIYILIKNNLY